MGRGTQRIGRENENLRLFVPCRHGKLRVSVKSWGHQVQGEVEPLRPRNLSHIFLRKRQVAYSEPDSSQCRDLSGPNDGISWGHLRLHQRRLACKLRRNPPRRGCCFVAIYSNEGKTRLHAHCSKCRHIRIDFNEIQAKEGGPAGGGRQAPQGKFSQKHKGTLLNNWNYLDRRILNSGNSTTSPTYSSAR